MATVYIAPDSMKDSKEDFRQFEELPPSSIVDSPQKLGPHGVSLFPQPSDDPNDPLNWPSYKKHCALISLSYGSFVCYVTGTIIASGTPAIAADLHVSKAKATYILTTPVILFAFGPLIWVAAAHFTGRRPALLLGSFLGTVFCIGPAVSSNYGVVLFCRYIQALGVAGPLALGPASVRDMYFRHELGKMIGVNTILLVISPFAGGIIGGPIIQNLGWRWSQWISVILVGFAFAAYVVFVPETIYIRGTISQQKTRFGFRTPERTERHSFWFVLTRPIVMFSFPAVTMPCLWFGLAYMSHVGITSNISLIFESPPYKFTITQTGLTFFSGLIGAFIGELFAGPVIDYLAKRQMKSGKEWHPEMHFRAIWLALCMMPTGLIVFGVTIKFSKSWVAPLVGNGTFIFGVEIMTTVIQTYIIECYPDQAMEASLVLNVMRNIFSFSTPFFLSIWIGKNGAAIPFAVFAVIGVVFFFPLVLPVILKGPTIREKSGKPDWGKSH